MHGHPRYIHTCLCDGENKKKKKKTGRPIRKKDNLHTGMYVCMYVMPKKKRKRKRKKKKKKEKKRKPPP